MIHHNQPPEFTESSYAAVRRVLESGWVGQGPEVAALEEEFARDYEGKTAVVTTSGTAALYLALRALGVCDGDIVAIPAYACISLLHAVRMVRAFPLVLDCEEHSLDVKPEWPRNLRPKVAILPHTFGIPYRCEMPPEVKVIEDCCQAYGTIKDGKPVGSFGDVAVFSFGPTKMITGGMGGLLLAAPQYADFARDLRGYDSNPIYRERFNFQLSDINAALIREQIWCEDDVVIRRRKAYRTYDAYKVAGELNTSESGNIPNGYRYCFRFETHADAHSARVKFSSEGIETIYPIEPWELISRFVRSSKCPNAEAHAERILSLPTHPRLGDGDIAHVARVLREVV